MSNSAYPTGDIGELLKTFLSNRVENLPDDLQVTDAEWKQAWDIAHTLRDLVMTFSGEDDDMPKAEASLRRQTLRVLPELLETLKGVQDSVDLIRIAIEHVFAEAFISEAFPQLSSRVKWLALKVVSWKLEEKSKSLHYLRLVARTYLLGLDQVCLVMGRGALESWLEENIS
jgi:hypothetical protein